MATTFNLKSSTYDGRYLILYCSQTQDISTNSSVIKWTLSAVGGSENYYSTGPTKVIINGSTVYSIERKAWNSYVFPAAKGSVSGTITVPHNANGTKTITVSLSTAIYESTVTTVTNSWALERIMLYGTSVQSLNSKTEESIKMNWSSDNTVDYLWYSTDNGSSWTGVNVTDGTSGTYTISGLTANTTYKIKTRIRRKDSQLTTNSTTQTITTYNYPYCTSTPDFTLGDALTLKFYNPLGRSFNFYIIGNGTQIDVTYKCSSTSYTGVNYAPTSVAYLYATIPNAKSGKYKVKVVYGTSEIITDNGNIYSIKTDECYADFNGFTYKDTNSAVTAITGDNQILVKGISTLSVEIPIANKMTPKNSATGKNYIASIDTLSKTIAFSATDAVSGVVGAVTSAGTQRLTVTAYDSRGLGTSIYKDITVCDYEIPVINAEVTRLNNFEAQTTLKVSGSYSTLDIDGTAKNTLQSVQYRYKETGGTWQEWTALTTTITNGKFTCNDVILSLDQTKSFNFQIKVVDNLSSNTVKANVDTGQAVFFISTNQKACFINSKLVLHDTNMVNEANTDLNDYLTTGYYFFGADYTPVNIPAGVNGWLEVIGSTSDRIKQIWYRCGTVDSNDFMTYTRTYIAGTWSSWSRLATLTQEYINDKTQIADYIIEQGTTDGWTYEKWASGKAVCWCTVSKETAETSVVDTYLSFNIALPFTFVSRIPALITGSKNAWAFYSWYDNASGTNALSKVIPVAYYHTSNLPSGSTVSIAIEIRGTWK